MTDYTDRIVAQQYNAAYNVESMGPFGIINLSYVNNAITLQNTATTAYPFNTVAAQGTEVVLNNPTQSGAYPYYLKSPTDVADVLLGLFYIGPSAISQYSQKETVYGGGLGAGATDVISIPGYQSNVNMPCAFVRFKNLNRARVWGIPGITYTLGDPVFVGSAGTVAIGTPPTDFINSGFFTIANAGDLTLQALPGAVFGESKTTNNQDMGIIVDFSGYTG